MTALAPQPSADPLAPLVTAERWLMEAQAPLDFVHVMDAAEVARVMARRAKLGVSASNRATYIKLEAERGLAAAIDRGQAEKIIAEAGRPNIIYNLNNKQGLADIGVSALKVHQARLIALAAQEIDFRELADTRTAEGEHLTRAEVIKIGRRIESGIADGQGDDWYTPGWLFDALGLQFDLDVCAPDSPTARTCPADRYLTEADDGLAREWSGLVWCNPPYSDAGPWARRVLDHGDGVLLAHIPANAAWAVDLWRRADVMVFLQAVEFMRPNGKTYRPGYALQLCGVGGEATAAVIRAARVTSKAGDAWERIA